MQLASLALLVQETAAAGTAEASESSSFYLTSSAEGIVTITIWLVPIMLGTLAAASPAKSKKFYPLLLPGFLAAIFISLMASGRLFFAGYMLAQGDLGDATLSAEDSVRFSAAAATAYGGLLAAFATGLLSMIAAWRTEGVFPALSWIALLCATNFAFGGIGSIFDQFTSDGGKSTIDATHLAQSQMDAWGGNPLAVGVCLLTFIILRYLASKANSN